MSQRYIAFLRGINVGKRRPTKGRLCEVFEELGFEDVETFIASGNVLFTSRAKRIAPLESRIAAQLENSFGYAVDTFIRTAEEVRAIGRADIFPEEGKDGVTVHVGFLHGKLPAKTAHALAAIKTDDDEFRVRGHDYYWLCRVRVSQSKVWSSAAMKALKLPSSSMRNLTTIRKLIAQHLE